MTIHVLDSLSEVSLFSLGLLNRQINATKGNSNPITRLRKVKSAACFSRKKDLLSDEAKNPGNIIIHGVEEMIKIDATFISAKIINVKCC